MTLHSNYFQCSAIGLLKVLSIMKYVPSLEVMADNVTSLEAILLAFKRCNVGLVCSTVGNVQYLSRLSL